MIDRLLQLRVRDFRSFREPKPIDLDADVVLIHGQNAVGKSSLLQALELGLTGSVADLSRFDESYPACLTRYRSVRGAGVDVAFLDHDGKRHEQSASLPSPQRSGRILREGPLKKQHVDAFRERCYLSQYRLSRLLELYQTTQPRHREPPLISFIRELLDLDVLEHLESGLDFVKDIRSAGKAVPELGRILAALKHHEAQAVSLRDRIVEQRQACSTAVKACQRFLEEHPEVGAGPEAAWTEDGLRRRMESVESEAIAGKAAQCATLQAALTQMRTLYTDITQADLPPQTEMDQFRGQLAALEAERATMIPALLAQVESAAEALQSAGDDYTADLTLAAIEHEWERCAVAVKQRLAQSRVDIATHEHAEAERQTTENELNQLNHEWDLLASRVSREQSATRSLLEALQIMLNHTAGEICPVCDRDFSETGQQSLHDHIDGKLTELNDESSLLQSMVDLQTKRENVLGRLEQRKQSVDQAAEPRGKAEQRVAVLDGAARQFAALDDTWKRFRDVVTRERECRAELPATESSREQLDAFRSRVSAIETLAGIEPSEEPMSLIDRVNHSGKQIADEAQIADEQHATLKQYAELMQSACSTAKHLTALHQQLETCATQCDRLTVAVNDAKQMLAAGREVKKQAASTKAEVVNRVFSGTLNRLWRDLFERLVLSESFHPQLTPPKVAYGKLSTQMSAAVAGKIEFPDLAAVLSTGNLNTAALSLFLALNVIESPVHRLMILDDPVQNMDDVHVMQLAAVLKAIARDAPPRGRQLFVAVHDRSLFEYLRIELGPTRSDESLITIELDRPEGSFESSIASKRFEWTGDCITFRRAEA